MQWATYRDSGYKNSFSGDDSRSLRKGRSKEKSIIRMKEFWTTATEEEGERAGETEDIRNTEQTSSCSPVTKAMCHAHFSVAAYSELSRHCKEVLTKNQLPKDACCAPAKWQVCDHMYSNCSLYKLIPGKQLPRPATAAVFTT